MLAPRSWLPLLRISWIINLCFLFLCLNFGNVCYSALMSLWFFFPWLTGLHLGSSTDCLAIYSWPYTCWLVSIVGLQHIYWTTAWLIGWTVWETFQKSSSSSCFPDCSTKLPFEKRPSLISVFRCIIVLLGTQSKCFVASLNNSSDGEREIICPSRTLMQFSVLFQDELFSWRRNCWRYSPKEIEWTSRELAFPGQPNGHFVQTSFN